MPTKELSIKKESDKPVVLVVEDEASLLKVIKQELENRSFKVITAKTGSQAIGHLEKQKQIDFIWLDHYLIGQESGLDLFDQIKKQKKWKNIPIFLISNTATDEKIEQYVAMGINRHYAKATTKLDTVIDDIEEFLEVK